ncbi:MAG: hypothetical protein EXQ74_00980 [Thermoleophilia bacterium]|nr:hypothetical protein [Thermoleophilia bacterium]
MEVANLVASETTLSESLSVSAALAVLAGIAASDAACCAALGERSRSQDHHDAETLLARITPGGPDAANCLRRLIDEKDNAHYGLSNISQTTLMSLLRQGEQLLSFAERVLLR